jgi:hypothetical protein
MPGRELARLGREFLILAEVRQGAGENEMQAQQPDDRSDHQGRQAGKDSFHSRFHENINWRAVSK